MAFDASILQPGDLLLYRPSGFWGRVIAVKTWARVSHVEVYIGKNESVGSREVTGVQLYPTRLTDLGVVLRSKKRPELDQSLLWFYAKAQGQKYDYIGLLCFTLAVKQGSWKKQFCSEFATRFLRHGHVDAVSKHWPADKVAPGSLLMSPEFEIVWTDGKPF